jgi:transcriptional regulator with XRE-family HTH domain
MAKQNHKYGYNWYFGKTVAYIRKLRNIKQKDFADKLRVNQSTISRIENGQRAVKMNELSSIGVALGLQSSDLNNIVTKAFGKRRSNRDETSIIHDIVTTCDEYID